MVDEKDNGTCQDKIYDKQFSQYCLNNEIKDVMMGQICKCNLKVWHKCNGESKRESNVKSSKNHGSRKASFPSYSHLSILKVPAWCHIFTVSPPCPQQR